MMVRLTACLVAVAALFGAGGAASAQPYPNRAITMIVPFAAGGASDVIARIVGEEMSRSLGQRLVPENIGGAGGVQALTRASRAAPDGYTIVIGNAGTNAATYSVHDNLTFTPDHFVPVGMVAKSYSLIAVRQNFPAGSLQDLIAEARRRPGEVRIGHAGVGSQNFLICRAFMAAANVDVQLVSYRGAGPALNDLMGGHVDGVCDSGTSLAQSVRAGQVKALAVAAPQRMPMLAEVPTSAEAGLPEFQMQSWNAFFVPRGTPQEVIDRLNRAIREALASDFVRSRFTELTTNLPGADEMAPEAMVPIIARDIARFRVLMAGAKP